MVSPLLAKPLRTHLQACAEIAAAAYGAPLRFRITGEWVPASKVPVGSALPDAMMLPQARVVELDESAAVEMLRRFSVRGRVAA